MATTLLLDRATNDLCLDAYGNIALASEPYSQVQDVASEAKVWLGEAYYDTTIGVPYRLVFEGGSPVSILEPFMEAAAKRVPGVDSATAILDDAVNRSVDGQIQIPQGTVIL